MFEYPPGVYRLVTSIETRKTLFSTCVLMCKEGYAHKMLNHEYSNGVE